MLDYNCLELIVNDRYSFVGIERRDDRLYFYLPKGFNSDDETLQTFSAKRDLFFLLYQVFDKFKQICVEKGYLEENSEILAGDRDGVIKTSRGSAVGESDDEDEIIFYGKLSTIEGILSAYDEPKILSLVYRLGKVETIDYSKFHKFLHRAVFLPNNAAYIDYMDLPRKQVQFTTTDLVAMYCYLLYEIKLQLNQEVRSEIKALAEQFRQEYIGADYGLFEEDFFEIAIDTLKEALEVIDRNTPLKDADYWQFYEAIELFLYGELQHTEEGEIWGINNFYSVWESMCLTDIVKTTEPRRLLYLDRQFVSDTILASVDETKKAIDLSDTFYINGSRLRPDAVVIYPISNLIGKRSYKISPDQWNDRGYRTSFDLLGESLDNFIKIACMDPEQPKNMHTFVWLEELYETSGSTLIINRRLPENFYSFWKIDTDDLYLEDLHKMYYFNHIFACAYNRGIVACNSFDKDVLKVLGIPKNTIVLLSLFREGIYTYYRINELAEMFNSFSKKLHQRFSLGLTAIDVKYADTAYYLDSENMEEIKNRSVRKQFVYEYLIEKTIDRSYSNLKNIKIQSEFWLPKSGQDADIKETASFMDGYIQLNQRDFQNLARNYINSLE